MAVTAVHDEQFQQHIATGRPIIVKYYADWCSSCRLFAPTFTRLSSETRFQSIDFLEVNADISPVARQTAGVDSLPFFATFKDGTFLEGRATANEGAVVAMLQKISA